MKSHTPVQKKQKLDILLIIPSQKKSYGKFKPPVQLHMGLAYLAASIAEHNVKLLDMNTNGADTSSFIKTIKNGKFDIAGFSVTTPTFLSSLALANLLKSYSPQTTVVFGGIHAAMHSRETLESDSVNLVVKGEGELTFKEIAACVRDGRSFKGVAGTLYKENGNIKENPPRPLISDLDSLPFPARDLFEKRLYTYPDALHKNTAPIITSRGCPGACTFCVSHNILITLLPLRKGFSRSGTKF